MAPFCQANGKGLNFELLEFAWDNSCGTGVWCIASVNRQIF